MIMSRRAEYQAPWFNERLNNALDNSGLSVDELAQRSGLPRSSVYNWINGVGWPSIPNMLKLEAAMGLERGALIKK